MDNVLFGLLILLIGVVCGFVGGFLKGSAPDPNYTAIPARSSTRRKDTEPLKTVDIPRL